MNSANFPIASPLRFQQFHVAVLPVTETKLLRVDEEDAVPSIRIIGKTSEGVSICCLVRKYQPVLYVPLPATFTRKNCSDLKTALNELISSKIAHIDGRKNDVISKVNLGLIENSTNGEQNPKTAMITVCTIRFFPGAFEVLNRCKVNVPGCGVISIRPFAKGADIASMFMREYQISGFCWIELPENAYKIVSDQRVSTCHMEVIVDAERIITHESNDVTPLNVLCFDIECLGRPGIFPEAAIDPVIQISSVTSRHSESEPHLKRLFTLGTCAPIEGATTSSFENEKDLLEAWASFVRDMDVDMLVGHNVLNFDLRYLLNRSRVIKADIRSSLSRIIDGKLACLPATIETRLSDRQDYIIDIPGRLIFDVYLAIAYDPAYKYDRYRLEDISTKILGFGKADVRISEIPDLQRGDEKSRSVLGRYCLQDSWLLVLLLAKTDIVNKYAKKISGTGLQFHDLTCSGSHVINVVTFFPTIPNDLIDAKCAIGKKTFTFKPLEAEWEELGPLKPKVDQKLSRPDFQTHQSEKEKKINRSAISAHHDVNNLQETTNDSKTLGMSRNHPYQLPRYLGASDQKKLSANTAFKPPRRVAESDFFLPIVATRRNLGMRRIHSLQEHTPPGHSLQDSLQDHTPPAFEFEQDFMEYDDQFMLNEDQEYASPHYSYLQSPLQLNPVDREGQQYFHYSQTGIENERSMQNPTPASSAVQQSYMPTSSDLPFSSTVRGTHFER